MLDLYDSYKADKDIFSEIPGGTKVSSFLKEETIIRLQGQEAWEEYSRKIMLANAEAWLADTDKEVEILRNSLKVQFTQNADGGLEEWDQSSFFGKFDNDYQELRKTIITNLKGENGDSQKSN